MFIMKKATFILSLILAFTLFFACSTSNDSNGNSTTTVVPISPTNLSGTVISTTQINLSWTDNSTNETGFKIERKTGTGTYAVVGTVNADVLTYTNLGLTPNTAYTYRVYSYNAAGNSPTYSNEVTLTNSASSIMSVVDFDGNVYPLVNICGQFWMKTNFDVSHYRNGDVIPQVTDDTQWSTLTTGAWCYYNNDLANGAVYGKLYNWYAINDSRGLAPEGFHIPSEIEWTTMINCLDPNANGGATNPIVTNIAGGKMKEAGFNHWNSPNTDANNISGFTGIPGGHRYNYGGYIAKGDTGYWWSSTANNSISNLDYSINYNNSLIYKSVSTNNSFKTAGYSVRCIRD
jgi:uncharacterized protein (TIGR02145 family)